MAQGRFGHRLTVIAAGLSVLVGMAVLTVSVGGGGAALPKTLTVVPAAVVPDPTNLAFEGRTFDQVVASLAGDTTPTVPLAIPGLLSIADVPVATATDPGTRVVSMTTEAPLDALFGVASPLAGVPVDLMLTARWDSVLDTNPDVALAVRAADQRLDDLYGGWGAIPDLPDEIGLSDVVLAFTDEPMTLDPATIPAVVEDFYGVDGPLDEVLSLDEVANLRGALDKTVAMTVAQVAEFLGVDPDEAIVLAGSLADTAAILFDDAAFFDPDSFSLDGPVAIDSSLLPDWLQNRVPEFRLGLGPAPERIPSVFVADEFDVVTGGVGNTFTSEVALIEAADLDVTVEAGTFTVPFGLGWMGSFENVALHLHQDFGGLEAEFEADVPVTAPKPRLHIAVKESTESNTAEVSVDGDVPLADLVSWLDGSTAFPGSDFDPASVGDTVIESVEFTYGSTPARTVFGLFAKASGIDALNASLDVQALVAAEDTPTTDPTLLVALRVSDPGCNAGKCIALSQVIPFGDNAIAGDLTFPAVNFAMVLPDDANFDPTGLGPSATAFLTGVLGEAPVNPVQLEADLNFSAELQLGDYDDLFAAIGWNPNGGAVRLEGAVGITLGALSSSGTTVNVLDELDFRAEFPGVQISAPPGLPAWFAEEFTWPGVGAWSLYLRFAENAPNTDADDTLAFGAAISDIETTLLDGSTSTLDVEAAFSGTPSTGAFAISLRGALGEWAHPFGVDFLTVEGTELRIEIPSGGSPVVTLGGAYDIKGEQVTTEIAIAATSPAPSVTVTLCLVTDVSGSDIMNALFGADAPALPNAFKTARVGPGCMTLGVTGEGEFTLDTVLEAGFTAFPGRAEIGAEVLLSAAIGGDPRITFGVRPTPGLKLSDLMPTNVALPIDFDLTAPTLDDGSFALVVSSTPVPVDDPNLPQATRDWYAPLFGGITAGETVSDGFSALGAFALPDLLGDFVENLGVDRHVTATGNIPLPGIDSVGFGLTLGLKATPAKLPEFVESAGIHLGLSLTLDQNPKLEVSLGGDLGIRFKQGADPALTDALTQLGVDLDVPVANPSGACPRGGLKQPEVRIADGSAAPGSDSFCYDVLDLELEGTLGINLLPPKIEATIGAELTSRAVVQGDNTKGWAPLGIADENDVGLVVIQSLEGRLGVTLEPGPQGAVLTLKLGVAGLVTVLGNSVNGGIQIGMSVSPLAVTPFFAVVPAFDGLRFALPQGIGVEQLRTIVTAVGGELPAGVESSLPAIQLRNLEFSLSPFGVDELCIPLGLQIRGDLYVDATVPNTGTGPVCSDDGVYTPPAAAELCPANEANGCVAGVFISLGLTGVIVNGFVSGFDLGPIHTSSAILDLKLALPDPHLRIEGGVTVNPLGDGFVRFTLEPTAIEFEGEIDVFDVSQAYVRGSGALDFTNPGFAFDATFRSNSPFAQQLEELLDGLMNPFVDDAEIAKNAFRALSSNEATARDALNDLGVGIPAGDDLRPSQQIAGFVEAAAQLGGVSVAAWMKDDLALGALDLTGGLVDVALGLACAVPPGDDDADGFSDLYGFPCSMSALLGFVGDSLENAFAGAEDVGAAFEIVLDRFLAGGGISVNCATFGGSLSLLETGVELGLDMDVLGQPFQQSVDWSFSGDPFADGQALFDAMLDFVYFEEDENVNCETPPAPVGPSSGMILQLEDATIDEGALARLTGLFVGGDDADTVTVDWGDGVVTNPGADAGGFEATHSYGDDGTYTITVTSSITPDTETRQIRVANLKPTLTLPADGLGNEGDVITLGDATYGDPGLDDTHTATIAWGDGTTAEDATVGTRGLVFPSEGNIEFPQHVYADNGIYTATICVKDDDNATTCRTLLVLVGNVPPTVDAGGNRSIAEGSALSLGTVDFNDHGTLDTHTSTVEWGDGSYATVTQAGTVSEGPSGPPGETGGIDGTSVFPTHAYADNGPYTVSVCVKDDDLGQGCDTFVVTVTNVDPIVAAGGDRTVPEGSAVALAPSMFNDKGTRDTHTATVDWDDGTVAGVGVVSEAPFGPPGSTAGANGSVAGQHVYADNGVYSVEVCVTDDDGGSDCDTLSVTVTNVVPTVNAGPDATVAEGTSFPLAPATFNDKGTLDTHTATVNWGDGTTTEAGVVTESPFGPPGSTAGANGTVAKTHVYADNGAYTVTACVTDDEGAEKCDTLKLTVTNVDPTGTFAVVGDGPSFFLPFVDVPVGGTHHDQGTLDTHTAGLAWGDGGASVASITETPTGPPGSVAGMDGTWTTVHAYAEAGDFTAIVTVTDDDGGIGTANRVIEVVTPAEAVRRVITAVTTLRDSNQTPKAVGAALTEALKQLEGSNGGKPNPGALDKLNDGDDSAALVKIEYAIDALGDALKVEPTLEGRNTLLILTQVAESVSRGLLIEATGLIDSTSPGQVTQIAKLEAKHAAGKALKVEALAMWDSGPATSAARSASAMKFEAAVDTFHVVTRGAQGLGAG